VSLSESPMLLKATDMSSASNNSTRMSSGSWSSLASLEIVSVSKAAGSYPSYSISAFSGTGMPSLVPDSFSSELVNIVLSSMKLASSYIMTSS